MPAPYALGLLTPALCFLGATGDEPTPAAPSSPQVVRQFLSGAAIDWEPSLDVGPDGLVAVVATRKEPWPADRALAPEAQAPASVHVPVFWISRDGGRTYGDAVRSPEALDFQGDPRIKIDAQGGIWATWIGFSWDATGTMPDLARGGLMLAHSTDRGGTYTLQTVQGLLAVGDKPELAVSAQGRDVYVAYTGRTGTLDVAASHDGGATWAHAQAHEDVALYWPTALALASDGALWLTHPRLRNGMDAPVAEYDLELASSRDSGQSFETRVFSHAAHRGFVAAEDGSVSQPCVHGDACPRQVPYPVVAVDAQDRVYVASAEGAVDRPYTLRFRSSADGGRTWSDATDLPAAPRPSSGDVADHFYPMVAAGGDGLVYVAWFDDRTGALNLWARRSVDAGRTWSEEVRLSRADRAGFPGIFGEYGGAAVDGAGALHVTWAEGEGHVSDPGASGGVWVARWSGEPEESAGR